MPPLTIKIRKATSTARALRQEIKPLSSQFDTIWQQLAEAHASGDDTAFERLNAERKRIQHEMCVVSRKNYGFPEPTR